MIQLPTACHENWDTMTPVEGGRHCSSCSKVLPDFTKLSNEEISDFIEKNGAGCGYFRTDQVTDGPTEGGWKYYSKWRTAISMLLVGSMFLAACHRRTAGMYSAPKKHWLKGKQHKGQTTTRARFLTNDKEVK